MLKVKMYLKVFDTLDEAQSTIKVLKEVGLNFGQMSVVGKLPDYTEQYYKPPLASFTNVFSTSVGVGFLHIPEIGEAFVAGSLSSLFLNTINGKALGALNGGLAGIFAGYGVEKKASLRYIDHLKKGRYLVIVNGHSSELKLIKEVMKNH